MRIDENVFLSIHLVIQIDTGWCLNSNLNTLHDGDDD